MQNILSSNLSPPLVLVNFESDISASTSALTIMKDLLITVQNTLIHIVMMKKVQLNRNNDKFNNIVIEIAKSNPWMYDNETSIDDDTKEKFWAQIDNELRSEGININSEYIIFIQF